MPQHVVRVVTIALRVVKQDEPFYITEICVIEFQALNGLSACKYVKKGCYFM